MHLTRHTMRLKSCHQPSAKVSKLGATVLSSVKASSFVSRKYLVPRRQTPLFCRSTEDTTAGTPSTANTPSTAGTPSTEPQTDAWMWENSPDALRTFGVFLAILLCGTLPIAQANKLADLPYFMGLAVCTIYMGAHRGLNAKQRQQINLKEGFLAPIAASVAIFGMYLLLKYFPNFSLQGFFDCYFWLLGSLSFIGAFAGPARGLGEKLNQPVWKIPLPLWLGAVDEDEQPIESSDLTPTDVIVLCAGIALVSADLAAHHGNFTLSNTIACLVAADILQLIGVSSFRVAAVLLCGLLAYDVFWVFGSPAAIGENVMLQVATSDALVGPTRLLFPRVAGSVTEASSFPFSLLGLGDVAVPGLLACLALRYDASRTVDMRARGIAAAAAIQGAIKALPPGASGNEVAEATGDAATAAYDRVADLEVEQRERTQLGISLSSGSVPLTTVYAVSDSVLHQRRYFVPVMVAYVLGLGVAFGANSITGLGQPALLYLVPATLGAVALTAARRGDLGRVWSYTDTSTAPLSPGILIGSGSKKGGDDDGGV